MDFDTKQQLIEEFYDDLKSMEFLISDQVYALVEKIMVTHPDKNFQEYHLMLEVLNKFFERVYTKVVKKSKRSKALREID